MSPSHEVVLVYVTTLYDVHIVERSTYEDILQAVSLSKWHMTTQFKFVKTVYNHCWDEL